MFTGTRGARLTEFGIFTVVRSGLSSGACLRAAPGIFTLLQEIVSLRSALKQIGD